MSTRLSDDAVGSIPKGRPTLELLGHRYQSVKLDLTTPSQVHSSLKLFGIWLSSLGSSRRCLQLASVSAVYSIEHAADRRPGYPHAYAEPFAAFPITDYRKSSTRFGRLLTWSCLKSVALPFLPLVVKLRPAKLRVPVSPNNCAVKFPNLGHLLLCILRPPTRVTGTWRATTKGSSIALWGRCTRFMSVPNPKQPARSCLW